MSINPFHREHADAWSGDFVDVPSLNREVSDAIVEAVERIRAGVGGDLSALRSESLLVLGPAGAGKTHLFVRLRRALGPQAAFVLVRPELGAEATPRHVLATIFDALGRRVMASDKRQIDVVVGAFLARMRGTDPRWAHTVLEDLSAMDEETRDDAILDVVGRAEDLYEEFDASWLELFLRAPFMKPASRRAALKWLSGREPNERELRRIGYKSELPDESVLPALRTLSLVASFGAPILLVFDQLENLVDEGDTGRITAHANLVAELYDSVRGLVLVQMALDGEWERRIAPILSNSQRSRLAARVELTRMPTVAERRALVEAWAAQVPAAERGSFPWPFSAEEWDKLAKRPVMTPRMLMIACRDALAGEAVLAPAGERSTVDARLAELWEEHLHDARRRLDHEWKEHGGLARGSLSSALVATLELAGYKVQRAKGKAKHDLVATVAGQRRWIYAMQHPHPRSVASILADALRRAETDPVLVIREQTLPFAPTWKTCQRRLAELEALPQATWWPLSRNEAARFLALHDFVTAARSQDLAGDDGLPIAEEVALEWARRVLDPAGWPFVSGLVDPVVAAKRPEGRAAQPSSELAAPGVAATGSKASSFGSEGPSAILANLGLASVERVVREVRTRRPDATRGEIVSALRDNDAVQWFGEGIVRWRGEAP